MASAAEKDQSTRLLPKSDAPDDGSTGSAGGSAPERRMLPLQITDRADGDRPTGGQGRDTSAVTSAAKAVASAARRASAAVVSAAVGPASPTSSSLPPPATAPSQPCLHQKRVFLGVLCAIIGGVVLVIFLLFNPTAPGANTNQQTLGDQEESPAPQEQIVNDKAHDTKTKQEPLGDQQESPAPQEQIVNDKANEAFQGEFAKQRGITLEEARPDVPVDALIRIDQAGGSVETAVKMSIEQANEAFQSEFAKQHGITLEKARITLKEYERDVPDVPVDALKRIDQAGGSVETAVKKYQVDLLMYEHDNLISQDDAEKIVAEFPDFRWQDLAALARSMYEEEGVDSVDKAIVVAKQVLLLRTEGVINDDDAAVGYLVQKALKRENLTWEKAVEEATEEIREELKGPQTNQ